jgi:S-DNA-T family DNA segregation ATPase FtsK/SpoIIIE
VEPVVRATHVEAPAIDAEERYPDLYGDEEEPPEVEEEPVLVEPKPDPAVAEAPEPPIEEEPEPERLTPQGERRSAVTEADDVEYSLPRESFLKRSNGAQKVDEKGIARTGAALVDAMSHFKVEGKVIGTVTGPHVTRYELRLAPGIKMSKVSQLKDDLAYALAAEHVRILAPIPGKQAVGVEVPNRVRKMVHLGDVFQEAPQKWSPLTVWLGKDIAGKAIGTDLAKQPHVLVAGTTGSGKSGCVNAMLSSILLRATPNEVRLVLVDPKRVELNHYEHLPHLLTPVVTSPRLAANVLGNLIKEMEERYAVMSAAKTRSLPELNRVRARQGERPLPYVLCVIDELADLMMISPAEVEDSIIRLAQKSRAVGIHLVLATQRPSADVITGMIKANVPARIAFAVASQTDSRVILDQNGAESLLGQGDMLFRPAGESRSARIQGAFITEEEIGKLTDHWRRQGEPELQEELLEAVEPEESEDAPSDFSPDRDDLLGEAISTVVQMGTASTSMLQRRLRVGYTRAGRLIDMMERRGVISGYEGSKARQVLITEADLSRVLEALEEPVGAASEEPV